MLRAQVDHAAQRLTMTGDRLGHGAQSLVRRRRERFAGLEVRLKASRLANVQAQRNVIARDRERAQRLADRAKRALVTLIQRQDARIAYAGQLLTALSYRSVLTRGFALVRDSQGAPLHAAAGITAGTPPHPGIRRWPRGRHRRRQRTATRRATTGVPGHPETGGGEAPGQG